MTTENRKKALAYGHGTLNTKKFRKWVNDEFEGSYRRTIETLLDEGDINTAKQEFKEGLNLLKDYGSNNLGSIIVYNQDELGEEYIINDLFNGLFNPNSYRRKEKEYFEEKKYHKPIIEFEKKTEKKRKFFYAYDKTGKKQRANYKVIITKKGKEYNQYRSTKTNKILSKKNVRKK